MPGVEGDQRRHPGSHSSRLCGLFRSVWAPEDVVVGVHGAVEVKMSLISESDVLVPVSILLHLVQYLPTHLPSSPLVLFSQLVNISDFVRKKSQLLPKDVQKTPAFQA